jgi:CheY-like chemotaxis protein
MIEISTSLVPPAAMLSFVQMHVAKVGNYDPSEKEHLTVVPVLAQPVDDKFDPVAPPRAVVTRDISSKSIGLVHSTPFRDPLLALQMLLGDEQVNIVVELQWSMNLGVYHYSGGRIVSALASFPSYALASTEHATDDALRRHILVVDDSFVSTQLVQSSLEQSGYETTVASDGREAWMKAQEQQFDLILTDEQMPVMKGTELCRLLRIHELYRETPIFLFTTNGELDDLSELEEELHVGVTVYKTFEPMRLLSTIQSAFCAPDNSGPTAEPESCNL